MRRSRLRYLAGSGHRPLSPFSPRSRRAEILIEANLCCCCCLPVPPCLPAWFVLPGSCVRFEAIQADEGSNDGTDWVRQSSICGGDFEYTYNLVEVYKEDGSPGRPASNSPSM